jgi:peptidoglycan hydrolase CwlO-like protein
MDDWNAALRLTSVFAATASIALAASVYEIDRREKSSTDTMTASLADLDQQVQLLNNRVRILGNQYARQIEADQRRIQALANQIDALSNQYETRLKQLEETVRTRR